MDDPVRRDRAEPLLSVVVAPMERGRFLVDCLVALHAQRDPPPIEIIVPVDGSIADLQGLARRFPDIRLVDTAGIDQWAEATDPGVLHLAIDRRRAVGLAAARAPLVALIEERIRPAPDWCRNIVAAHRAPHAAIGGSFINLRDRPVNWGLFFFDLGRYIDPDPSRPAGFVSDANVSYKSRLLAAVADSWRELYDEAAVHDALRRLGGTIRVSPELAVGIDRGVVSLDRALRERFAWARLYAGRRSRRLPAARRVALAVGSPLLVAIFLVRQGRHALGCARTRIPFLRSLPVLLLLDVAAAAGELVGYVSGRPTSAG